MKSEHDKELEQLVEKFMENSQTESPSFEFTSKVMQEINQLSVSKSIAYKPLISKTVWWLLSAGLCALVLYIVFIAPSQSKEWASSLPLEYIKIPKLNVFSGIKFSQSTMYGMAMLAIMVMVQIPLLKHYFNSRLKV
ncbi:hypothetical protein [Mangrovimonas sp. DI 80]|uniref:hypothetical protein n=1 Tax=Mangrovimonas sp. DI 80 TaxID=1779330 RepID=UPI000975FD05|nr:hypothetical protein [Mangrovimonas sp. DI 80]OMP31091.1 hypothetical protein BKM32_08480 [Mangrovimonas sp. DI 80]